MRHARPVPPVSRIGQNKVKRNMAQPIKDKQGAKNISAGLPSRIKQLFYFFRKRASLTLTIVVLGSLSLIGLFTPVLKISAVEVELDAKSGCLSEQYVRQYVLTQYSYVWSHLFFEDDELRAMHPCLEKLEMKWNPFSPKSIKAKVIAREPVLRVQVQIVQAESENLGTDSIFFRQVVNEEVWFMLGNGTLVQLDAEPQIPSITLRHNGTTSVQSVVFTADRVKSLLQLINFCEQDLGFTPELMVNDYGVVRFSAPFSQNVFISLRNDLRVQLGSLQSVLRASTIDRSKLYSLDVRSGNAIIRFSK
jgi:hypothetical protein